MKYGTSKTLAHFLDWLREMVFQTENPRLSPDAFTDDEFSSANDNHVRGGKISPRTKSPEQECC